jgi:hypothetical protein
MKGKLILEQIGKKLEENEEEEVDNYDFSELSDEELDRLGNFIDKMKDQPEDWSDKDTEEYKTLANKIVINNNRYRNLSNKDLLLKTIDVYNLNFIKNMVLELNDNQCMEMADCLERYVFYRPVTEKGKIKIKECLKKIMEGAK